MSETTLLFTSCVTLQQYLLHSMDNLNYAQPMDSQCKKSFFFLQNFMVNHVAETNIRSTHEPEFEAEYCWDLKNNGLNSFC